MTAAAFRVVAKADEVMRQMELVERGVYRIDPASVLALRSALVDLKVKANRR